MANRPKTAIRAAPTAALVTMLLAGICGAHAPEQPRSIRIHRVSRAPVLEDFLDGSPPNQEASVTDFRQREPGDGAPASQRTRAYLSYDDRNLYIVFVCDDEPGKVRGRMVKREDIKDDDQVTVYLDTFRDRQRAYIFAANPLGIQQDGILTEGGKTDYSFDTLWYSEGRLTPQGFVVWIAIPFKSLRFSDAKLQTWSIALGRSILRNNENSFWPYITQRQAGFVQQMGSLEGFEQISPGHNVQLIPYGTFTRSRFLDTGRPAFVTTDHGRAGLDSKIVVRDAFTLDVALNPDFSEVESNEPQVTVNQRFEVFFPEKRPFFIENAGFFETPVNLFFSRRIADPEFGARITGKAGRWAVGALGADDRAATDPLTGRHAAIGVVRVQREFGGQSHVGLLATSRDFGSASNRVFALDTRLKLNANWFFTGQLIRSYTQDPDHRRRSGAGAFGELAHNGRHFNYSGSYTDFSPTFSSQLGFIRRVDIRETDQYASYFWWPEGRRVTSFGPSVIALVNWDRTGRVQDWFASTDFAVYMTRQTQLKLSHSNSFELFERHGFQKHANSLSFFTGWVNWLAFFAFYSQGAGVNYSPGPGLLPFAGNTRDGVVTLTLRPRPRIRLDHTYIYSRLGTRPGTTLLGNPISGSVFNNHLVRWKTNYQFTRALSIRTIIDYNGLLPNQALLAQPGYKQLVGDILLTYLVNPGTALHVGYNNRHENLAIDATGPPALRNTQSPTIPTASQFFVKISYLLRF